MKTPLSMVSCKFGAPMGRNNIFPDNSKCIGKLYLEKLQWVDWDYDKGGAYWGNVAGTNIYRAYGETITTPTEPIEIFVRAKNRNEAKLEVKRTLLNYSVEFYR